MTHLGEPLKICISFSPRLSFFVLTCAFYSGKFLFISKSNYFSRKVKPRPELVLAC